MTQHIDQITGQLFDGDPMPEPSELPERKVLKPYTQEILWKHVYRIAFLHICTAIGVYLALTSTKWQTILYAVATHIAAVLGITAGAHRLWSHNSYKAATPLKVLLLLFHTITYEGDVFEWVRDHRVHHKYQETDADPHNAGRGLWFSHMGWLMLRKHPDVVEKGRQIDLSDIKADKLLMFQKKYYWPLSILLCLILPTIIPVYCWCETWLSSWCVSTCLRIVLTYHATWLINSVAHKYGTRPYDANFFAADSKPLVMFTLGEGWHNYHHAFPWDYKNSEMGLSGFNVTSAFIDFFAKIGWAYDLKTVSIEMVRKRALRTGDGSFKDKELWGWHDKDMLESERREATVLRRKAA